MDTHEQFTFLFAPSRFQEVCTRYTKDIYNGPRLKTQEQAANSGEADTHTQGDLYEHHGAGQTPSGGNEFAIINHASNRILHWPVATPHPQPQPQPNMQSLSPSSSTSTSISLFFCTTLRMCLLRCFLSAPVTRGRPQCAPQD